MLKKFIAIQVLAVILMSNYGFCNEQSVHVHGQANGSIIIGDGQAKVEIKVPSNSVVGFEYKAETAEDKASIKDAIKLLNDQEIITFYKTGKLFRGPSEIGVSQFNASVEVVSSNDHDSHDHDTHKEEAHANDSHDHDTHKEDTHDHDSHGHDDHISHDTHKEDAHADDSHDHDSHKEDAHDHDSHAHDDHSSHDQAKETHSEFVIQYDVNFDKDVNIDSIDIDLFSRLPNLDRLFVTVVTDDHQSEYRLNAKSSNIQLGK